MKYNLELDDYVQFDIFCRSSGFPVSIKQRQYLGLMALIGLFLTVFGVKIIVVAPILIILTVLYFKLYPNYVKIKTKKSVAWCEYILGETTLTFNGNKATLVNRQNNETYTAFNCIYKDINHFYIITAKGTVIIIPFRIFTNIEHKLAIAKAISRIGH